MLKQREMATTKYPDRQVMAKQVAKKTRDLQNILEFENQKKDVDKFQEEDANMWNELLPAQIFSFLLSH